MTFKPGDRVRFGDTEYVVERSYGLYPLELPGIRLHFYLDGRMGIPGTPREKCPIVLTMVEPAQPRARFFAYMCTKEVNKGCKNYLIGDVTFSDGAPDSAYWLRAPWLDEPEEEET